ncbi:bifunctional 2-C-methyl-D-erythritol 4-phosphate cytidylyltransferase/2-C-methyl-D-erythritol 2,4-cyclodiphosphate synthase [Limibacillus halophilus]|uniref:Bifunctional enzyme IspD/IspF n=1 Tax=Limibacillus halophilus TaxID=1579333 RepID=A0A839SV68_9PROT|nr:bifunctional 2-C-methyl-D-erythritol 4-phosphate cytidylyltransferase/2-C-methyl-D-erythritol 2,4-cyclodiphosphate synthase [Limibacillus halophilus]MBB3065919.1 2-C-methyl-D-erythritol 4-phosphate cytidylyltransferase/2-C-methyl-D-erythritol 2,4-cyclodiphosphate synthase [Limibacillus halophilus]
MGQNVPKGGTIALVVAAGRGTRAGGDVPKQYQPLGGRPSLLYCLETLVNHQAIDAVRVVIGPDDSSIYNASVPNIALLDPIVGGAERQESVRLGLESLVALEPRRVIIHDGARPFINPGLIDCLLQSLDSFNGAIPTIPVIDTLKRGDGALCRETVHREGLYRAQTPQAFQFQEILDAHQSCRGQTLTDDAAVAEAHGITVAMVAGDEDNMKLTESRDFIRAEKLLRAAFETRSGQGFDVHRLAPGSGIMLCGVNIPCDLSLIGHSDADVGLHAVVDAVLGALAEGDIGSHFPPSEARWRGADSSLFVKEAVRLMTTRHARLLHLDVTLICERPKVGPYREAMRDRLAGLFGVLPQRISVKATTTEQLGFTGRGEGIAAQALATLHGPVRESL